MNYLKILDDILNNSEEDYDSVTLINKNGFIEYTKLAEKAHPNFDMLPFEKGVIGKQIFDVYANLDEHSSNTIQTLKTGKICKIDNQVLTAGSVTVTISSTTYPIFDELGQIQGVVDAVRHIEYCNLNEDSEGEGAEVLRTIISENDKIKKMKDMLPEIARNDSSVFLYGETGTGKELFAQALHLLSNRNNAAFIAQNCAAIPENLMESTFFGTDTGGFTGAEKKQGLFELANHGTLFLDEINSMNAQLQAKLLTALEEKKIRRVGGQKDIGFDVRIICASNEDPWDLIRRGCMREDFYYRVSAVKLQIPPLRERPEDIEPLAAYFIDFYNHKMGKSIKGLSSMTKDTFLRWPWPGNVRELKNTIESAFNLEKNETISLYAITELLEKQSKMEKQEQESKNLENLGQEKNSRSKKAAGNGENEKIASATPFFVAGSIDSSDGLENALRTYEKKLITETLRKCRTSRAAAEQLRISPQKLSYRMKVLGINLKDL